MKYDYDKTKGDYDAPLNFARNTTSRLFLVVLFSFLSVVVLESVAVGDLLAAPNSAGKAFKMPTTNPALSGTKTSGRFLPSTGAIELRPGLSWAKMREVLRHEGVHKWFNPTKSLGPYTASVRRNIDGWLYNNSAFFNATEEIIAQGFATKNLRNGIQHAFNGLYKVRGNTVVSKWTYLGEAIPGAAGLGGLIYVGYGVGDWLWGNE